MPRRGLIALGRGGRASRLRTALLVVLLAVVAWYLVAYLRRIPADAPAIAIAHRGGPGGSGAPEGTLAAFEAAIAAGAYALEFDVRVTSDGVLVVLHDDTVDRTTNGHGSVAGMTFDHVRALDAGAGATIPTVQEVVDLAAASNTALMPEIKDGPSDPQVVGALVDILTATDSLDRTIDQAFEPEILDAIHGMEPRLETCLLTGVGQFEADGRAGWHDEHLPDGRDGAPLSRHDPGGTRSRAQGLRMVGTPGDRRDRRIPRGVGGWTA